MQKLKSGLLYLLSFGVAAYALVVYGFFPIGAMVHPVMRKTFEMHRVAVYLHIFCSALALLIGSFQFSDTLRQRLPNVHRWSGRAYLALGIVPGGLAGLYMASFSFGGMLAHLGFAALAAGWLFSGLMAYCAIRNGDIAEHKRWMIRNFALTFAAVTLRIWLPAMMISGVDFQFAYQLVAWLCWVPNIVLAEYVWNRTK